MERALLYGRVGWERALECLCVYVEEGFVEWSVGILFPSGIVTQWCT